MSAKTSASTSTTPMRARARKVRSTRKSFAEGGWQAESGLSGMAKGVFMNGFRDRGKARDERLTLRRAQPDEPYLMFSAALRTFSTTDAGSGM